MRRPRRPRPIDAAGERRRRRAAGRRAEARRHRPRRRSTPSLSRRSSARRPSTPGRRARRGALEAAHDRPARRLMPSAERPRGPLDRAAPRDAPRRPTGTVGRLMPPRRLRLDAELVRRGLARSREHAAELIAAGRVERGRRASRHKPATGGDHRRRHRRDAPDPDRPDYVSRGGHKLAGALAAFGPLGLVVAGRRCLDAGASTGGFTDVLLRAGAAEVVAVDVGYGQLAWSICAATTGSKVHDRTNIRDLTPDLVGGPVDVVVGDLSFISLRLVLDALLGVCAPGRRPGADGQAAVRGRQGPARQGRGGARPRAACRGGHRGRRPRRPRAAGARGPW